MIRFPPRSGAAVGRHAAVAACIALAACTAAAVGPDQPKIVRDQPLTPYDIREECLPLAVGDRLDYDFTATEPVKFTIRYHDGNAEVSPVVREMVHADSGVFAPLIARDYCLEWEAGPAGAVLEYRVRLRVGAR
jgi:hypothetical protein